MQNTLHPFKIIKEQLTPACYRKCVELFMEHYDVVVQEVFHTYVILLVDLNPEDVYYKVCSEGAVTVLERKEV